MSKDKGSKNTKKKPADKSAGNKKSPSPYKSESKSGSPTLPPFIPEPKEKGGRG